MEENKKIQRGGRRVSSTKLPWEPHSRSRRSKPFREVPTTTTASTYSKTALPTTPMATISIPRATTNTVAITRTGTMCRGPSLQTSTTGSTRRSTAPRSTTWRTTSRRRSRSTRSTRRTRSPSRATSPSSKRRSSSGRSRRSALRGKPTDSSPFRNTLCLPSTGSSNSSPKTRSSLFRSRTYP